MYLTHAKQNVRTYTYQILNLSLKVNLEIKNSNKTHDIVIILH